MLPHLCALVLAAGPGSTGGAADLDPFLRQYAETRRFMAGRPTSIRFAPDGRSVLFLRSGPRSAVQALLETRLDTGETRVLVAPEALAGAAAAPTQAEAAQLERQRIAARGITHYELSKDGARVGLATGGKLWILERATGAVRSLPVQGALDPRFSPDGRAIAFVKDRDLHVLSLATGKARRLTRARGPAITNGVAEFVAQEEMDRSRGYWWSPDGKRIAFAEVDEAEVARRTLCDPARPERPCSEVAYPRAGTANAVVRLGIVRSAGGAPVFARWDAGRYPYLAAVSWEEGSPLAILVQDRAQGEEVLLAVDPESGATRPLLEEKDEAWLNLWPRFPKFRKDGAFYWVTERNGAPEVELRGPDGARVATVVPTTAGFVDLVAVDEPSGTLWFLGAPDPAQEVLYRVQPGTPPQPLTLGEPGPASRGAIRADRGGAIAVTWSTLRRLPRTEVFAADGTKLADVPSVAEEPGFVPTTEIRKVGAGDGFYAAVLRPRAIGAVEKLPVIVDVYGGPVPARYAPRAAHRPMLLSQWLADQGFLVVSFDGRGTPRRGRAFERAIRGDFSRIPLEDQVEALHALAAELPQLDLDRVGIEGWSFGGYLSALAVMRRPDVFRAGVAGAPVAEWREYDTHYTERYLGMPDENRTGYDRSSLLGSAPTLERPLLVVHGTADDNVFLSHSLALADALFRAGRPFELLPIAGATHMVPEPVATARLWERIARHFRATLGGVPPRPATRSVSR